MSLLEVSAVTLVAAFWLAWVVVFVVVVLDAVRSEDLSDVARVGWVVVAVALPWVGVLAYLLVRGRSLQQRQGRHHLELDRSAVAYLQGVASAPSPAEEVARFAELRTAGLLTEDEFTRQKARLLGQGATQASPDAPTPGHPGRVTTHPAAGSKLGRASRHERP